MIRWYLPQFRGILWAVSLPLSQASRMSELNTFSSSGNRGVLRPGAPDSSPEPKQRRLMVLALSLLLIALFSVLYHDRDFWFPDADEAEVQTQEPAPSPNSQTEPSKPGLAVRKNARSAKPKLNASAQTSSSVPPFVAVSSRTVLPPLEVEVIAGDAHHVVRPPSNELKVDLDESPAQSTTAFSPAENDPAANVTSNAAERVHMSEDTSDVVSQSVEPGYPLLARQMKVQGSVVLMAMISRDGSVQDLRIVSGPPILATAAREAVRQWHFKPHLEGSQTVETIARVTVNFTISTN